MEDETTLVLDEVRRVSLAELVRASGLPRDVVQGLVELGVFEPLTPPSGEPKFASRCIALARTAERLRSAFELNLLGVALALTYVERIETLERRVRELECQALVK